MSKRTKPKICFLSTCADLPRLAGPCRSMYISKVLGISILNLYLLVQENKESDKLSPFGLNSCMVSLKKHHVSKN